MSYSIEFDSEKPSYIAEDISHLNTICKGVFLKSGRKQCTGGGRDGAVLYEAKAEYRAHRGAVCGSDSVIVNLCQPHRTYNCEPCHNESYRLWLINTNQDF